MPNFKLEYDLFMRQTAAGTVAPVPQLHCVTANVRKRLRPFVVRFISLQGHPSELFDQFLSA